MRIIFVQKSKLLFCQKKISSEYWDNSGILLLLWLLETTTVFSFAADMFAPSSRCSLKKLVGATLQQKGGFCDEGRLSSWMPFDTTHCSLQGPKGDYVVQLNQLGGVEGSAWCSSSPLSCSLAFRRLVQPWLKVGSATSSSGIPSFLLKSSAVFILQSEWLVIRADLVCLKPLS